MLGLNPKNKIVIRNGMELVDSGLFVTLFEWKSLSKFTQYVTTKVNGWSIIKHNGHFIIFWLNEGEELKTDNLEYHAVNSKWTMTDSFTTLCRILTKKVELL